MERSTSFSSPSSSASSSSSSGIWISGLICNDKEGDTKTLHTIFSLSFLCPDLKIRFLNLHSLLCVTRPLKINSKTFIHFHIN